MKLEKTGNMVNIEFVIMDFTKYLSQYFILKIPADLIAMVAHY